MKTRFLKQAALDELRNSIQSNLELYRARSFEYLLTDNSFSFEHELEIDTAQLANLTGPKDGNYFEPDNCTALYGALKNLKPYEARDERFWAFLSHTVLLEHARERWPIPASNEEAISHISKHFFAKNKRQIESDNVGSRLWWLAYLCARLKDIDQKDLLESFFYRSDVRANLVERPTTSQTVCLFDSILKQLLTSYKGKKALFERSTFRLFMREINSVGGYKLLDCLPPKRVDAIVKSIIAERLSLEEL